MCQSKAQGGLRCSDSVQKLLVKAIESGDTDEIRRAKLEYFTSTAGIEHFRATGREQLAERFARRREALMEKNKRQWRKENNVALAFDLDNTTADFTGAFRASLAKKHGLTKEQALERYPEPSDYSFVVSGWFKDTNEFLTEFHDCENRGLYKEMAIFSQARRTIQNLHNEGYTIHFVTARTEKFNADTKHALRRYRLPYHLLKHTEDKETHDAVLFFDDAPKQIKTLTIHGKKVIAYDNKYNIGHEGAGRVKSWSEIADQVTLHTSEKESKAEHY